MTWRKAHDYDPKWELVDDDGRIWGSIEDVARVSDAPKWTASLYGTGIIGRYVSMRLAKFALERRIQPPCPEHPTSQLKEKSDEAHG